MPYPTNHTSPAAHLPTPHTLDVGVAHRAPQQFCDELVTHSSLLVQVCGVGCFVGVRGVGGVVVLFHAPHMSRRHAQRSSSSSIHGS